MADTIQAAKEMLYAASSPESAEAAELQMLLFEGGGAMAELLAKAFSRVYEKNEDPEVDKKTKKLLNLVREGNGQDHLVFKEMDPECAKLFQQVGEIEGLTAVPLLVEPKDETEKERCYVMFSSADEGKAGFCEYAAKIFSGREDEVIRFANDEMMPEVQRIATKLEVSNNILQLNHALTEEEYRTLKNQMQKLDPQNRFTLITTPFEEDGQQMYNVAFPEFKPPLYDRVGDASDPPKAQDNKVVMKVLMADEELNIAAVPGYEKTVEAREERVAYEREALSQAVLGNNAMTPAFIKAELARLGVPHRNEIEKALDEYPELGKENIIEEINKNPDIPESTKSYLNRITNTLGNELYIVPIEQKLDERGKVYFQAVPDNSITIGRDVLVREIGKEDTYIGSDGSLGEVDRDLVLSKASSLAALDGNMDNVTVAVMTAEEFRLLHEPQEKERLSKEKYKSLNGIEERFDSNVLTRDQKVELGKATEAEKESSLIDNMNKKQQRGWLESDQDGLVTQFAINEDAYYAEVNNVIEKVNTVEGKAIASKGSPEIIDPVEFMAEIDEAAGTHPQTDYDQVDKEIEESREEAERENREAEQERRSEKPEKNSKTRFADALNQEDDDRSVL